MAAKENYLVLSDLQIPFHHKGALSFCRYLKKHFKVKDEHVLNVGDETDQYFGGMWKHSIEASHTANSEMLEAIDELHSWYRYFPKMKLSISNHGTRYWRKALNSDIPKFMLKDYQEVIEAPSTWVWQKHWLIEASNQKFIMEHGDDYGGQRPHLLAALHNGVSTIIGHHHSLASVDHIKTNGLSVWAAVTGSLIDFDQYAFEYAKSAKRKPCIGCAVVIDGGRYAIWIPLS